MMLAVIRHGSAIGNRDHRFIGWSSVPLDAEGGAQAEAVAARLEPAGIERIVSSDLPRALQTAAPLSDRLGIPIEEEPRLREINNGEWTGLLPEEIATGWPDLWQAYVNGTDVNRPGGEQWRQVAARVQEALADLDTAVPTAVFTHGGPVIVAAAWAAGIELPGNIFRGPLASAANASLTTIASGPRLVGYADVGHLRALPGVDVPYDPVT